jgi:exopolysaccharide biosynthesis polyprenyl glycosylphosphotransferase
VGARVAADYLVVAVVFTSMVYIRGHLGRGSVGTARGAELGCLYATMTVWAFARKALYQPQVTVLNLMELRAVLETSALCGAVFLAAVLLAGVAPGERAFLAAATLAVPPALVVERRAMAVVRGRCRWLGGPVHRTLVYGYSEGARLLMKKIVQAPEAGRTLVGFVDDYVPIDMEVPIRTHRRGSTPFRVRLLGRTCELVELVQRHKVTEILISSPDCAWDVLSTLERVGEELGVRWGIAAQFGATRPDELAVEDVGAIPVLRPSVAARRWVYPVAKRLLDITAALIGLVISLPLWVLAAAAIQWESGGPVLFRQVRVGKDGKPFTLLKFRSLRPDANPYQSSTRLRRSQTTRVGRLLRATTLDELPQLVNVLRGEMSLVGPRPEMPFLVEAYNHVQARRLTVQPGVTGVWQLSADRHGMEIHQNIEYDLFYITHRSFVLDLMILFETVVFSLFTVLQLKSASKAGLAGDVPAATVEPSPLGNGEYILLALDQRDPYRAAAVWTQALRKLLESTGSVKVLASETRLDSMRSALRMMGSGQQDDPGFEFVPYRHRAALERLLTGARCVVTDVDQFKRMADDVGTQVVDFASRESSGGR